MPIRRHIKVLRWRLKRYFDRYEARITDLLYGRARPTGKTRFFWWLMRFFEWLFRGIVALRLLFYRHGILKRQYLGCMVVIIGNITMGGTGKTPVVEKFARELLKRGRRVAILSRGYKRKEAPLLRKLFSILDPSLMNPVVVSDGVKIRCDWKRAGDEPYMLAENLPGAIVVVDKNRVKAGAYAIRKFGADTLILDDGFQYLPLKGRLQMVLVDQSNPFGSSAMIPRGILREPLTALGRADFVFITKSDGNPPASLLKKIAHHAPGVEPIVCSHTPRSLVRVDSEKFRGAEALPVSALRGKKVFCFSGIATPESFENALKKAGAELVGVRRYADHYPYEEEDIEQLLSAAARSKPDMIVTTEKDFVRLPRLSGAIPVYFLRMEIEILLGEAQFEKAVDRICGTMPQGHSRISA
jgi:tetraacyldisaccharide 4'-kinase